MLRVVVLAAAVAVDTRGFGISFHASLEGARCSSSFCLCGQLHSFLERKHIWGFFTDTRGMVGGLLQQTRMYWLTYAATSHLCRGLQHMLPHQDPITAFQQSQVPCWDTLP